MVDRDCEKCPSTIKLNKLCKDFEDLKSDRRDKWKDHREDSGKLWSRRDLDYEHWELEADKIMLEVNKRVKTSSALSALTIIVVVLLAVIGVMFGTVWNAQSNNAVNIAAGQKEHQKKMSELQTSLTEGLGKIQSDIVRLSTQLEERTKHHDKGAEVK